MKHRLTSALLSFGLGTSLCFGGEFVNLGFDDVDIGVFGGYQATVAQGLPGWTMTRGVGDEQLPYAGPVELNGLFGVSLHAEPHGLLSGYAQGNWISVSTHDPDTISDYEYRLAQRGATPEWAAELRLATLYGGDLYLNGTRVGYDVFDERPVICSIDISPYAGKEVALEFRTTIQNGTSYFDILGFYPIPEPSTVALLGLGGLGLGWRLRGVKQP